MASLVSAACQTPSEAETASDPLEERAQAIGEADGGSERMAAPATTYGSSDVQQLLSAMDLLGPGADDVFKRAGDRYLRSDPTGAKLRDAYRSLPAGARSSAAKIVYAASQLPNDGYVRLLEEVALSPTATYRDPHSAPAVGAFDDPGAADLAVKIQAAVGLAQQSATARTSTAAASVAKVLAQAEPEVSRMLGMELFSRGRFSAEHRSALERRGIFAAFRRLTDAEAKEFRTIDVATAMSPQKPKSNKPVYSTVPAEVR